MAIIRSTIAETITALNDQTSRLNGGSLELHAGTIPADGDTAVSPSGALVTFTLPSPAFATAVDATNIARATANPIADATAAASGTAGFAVFRDSGGTQLHMTDVTLDTGDGFVTMDDLTITSGEVVSVTVGTWDLPQAA